MGLSLAKISTIHDILQLKDRIIQMIKCNNHIGTKTNNTRTNSIWTKFRGTNSRGTHGICDKGYIGTNSREDKQ